MFHPKSPRRFSRTAITASLAVTAAVATMAFAAVSGQVSAAYSAAAPANLWPTAPQRWAPSDATPLIPSDVQIVRGPDVLRSSTWTASTNEYPGAGIWCADGQGELTTYWLDTNLPTDRYYLTAIHGSADRVSVHYRPLTDTPAPAGAYLTLNGTCSTKTAKSASTYSKDLPIEQRLSSQGDYLVRDYDVKAAESTLVSLVCPANTATAGYDLTWAPGVGRVTSMNYTKNGLSLTATSEEGAQRLRVGLGCWVDTVKP